MGQIRIEAETDMLGLIDIQPTFMSDGELAVLDGEAVVPIANYLLRNHFSHAFACQDWHPKGHKSFASSHEGKKPFDEVPLAYGIQTLYPDHAVQGSAAAQLHPDLDGSKIELIIRKGFRTEIDSYSAFFENDRKTSTGLTGYLRDRGFSRIFLVGMATDFCVAYTAEDAVRAGFTVFIVEDGCRGLGLPLPGGGTTLDAAKQRLSELGVHYVRCADLARSVDR